MLATTRLKYLAVTVTLASSFVAKVFFPTHSLFKYAFSIVAVGYWLAVVFLALSVLARKRGGEQPPFELGMKFLLRAPLALAAILSVVMLILELKGRNLCIVLDCLSADAFQFHIVVFVFGFIRFSLEFYTIIAVAALESRLIQLIENVCWRN